MLRAMYKIITDTDNHYKNQQGFTAVEGLLIVLILVVIGAVGYMVYQNGHKTKTVSIVTTSGNKQVKTTTKATAVPANPYTGWNTYILPKEKLTFHYPNTWTVATTSYTNSNNDGVQFTSKTDSSFEILIGAGQDVAAAGNNQNCVQQAAPVTFDNQTAYLDLVGFANTNADPPSCTPASSTIESVILSKSSTSSAATNFFLTKNIPQPAAPSASEIIVDIDYDGPNGRTSNNKTISRIEADTDYKDAKLVVASMSY